MHNLNNKMFGYIVCKNSSGLWIEKDCLTIVIKNNGEPDTLTIKLEKLNSNFFEKVNIHPSKNSFLQSVLKCYC